MPQEQQTSKQQYVRELALIEQFLLTHILKSSTPPLSFNQESLLRWALSFARVSVVAVKKSDRIEDVLIGQATDIYRQRLFELLRPIVTENNVDWADLCSQLPFVEHLIASERRDLLQMYVNQLSLEDLDLAVSKRPLAIALSGGGGTSYIFSGVFDALEKAGIRPSGIAATSMGSIVGAYRARNLSYDIHEVRQYLLPLTVGKLMKPFKLATRFGVPATLRLCLYDAISEHFTRNGEVLRLKDLKIPLRMTVGGFPIIEGESANFDEYANLLDDTKDVFELKQNSQGISKAILSAMRRPMKALYFGDDDLSKECNVIDAMGYSSAVPGVLHYDIWRDDPRMIDLLTAILQKHGVSHLIDGGVVDNLPAEQAFLAVQTSKTLERDPFVLALDGFAPNIARHWLFMPLMQFAASKSKAGREFADLTITYKKVLSPINVVPSEKEFDRVVEHGREETSPYLPFLQKMLSPISRPNILGSS